jgi:phycobilisome rod-core linker protein
MQMSAVWAGGQPPAWALKLWLGLFAAGGFELVRFVLTIAAEMLKTAQG